MNPHVSQLFPPSRRVNRYRRTPEERVMRMIPGILLGGAASWVVAYAVTTLILRA